MPYTRVAVLERLPCTKSDRDRPDLAEVYALGPFYISQHLKRKLIEPCCLDNLNLTYTKAALFKPLGKVCSNSLPVCWI